MFLRLIRRYTSGEITAHFLTVNSFFSQGNANSVQKEPFVNLMNFLDEQNRFHFSESCSQGYKKLFVESLERQAVGSELCPVSKHWAPAGHWEPKGWRMHIPKPQPWAQSWAPSPHILPFYLDNFNNSFLLIIKQPNQDVSLSLGHPTEHGVCILDGNCDQHKISCRSSATTFYLQDCTDPHKI